MICVVIALEDEARKFLTNLKCVKETVKAGKKVFLGKLENKELVVIVSGIGKVNAALSTQTVIDNYPIDYVINFGVAGGILNVTPAGQLYMVEKCIQYDFDVTSIDDVQIGYIQDYKTAYFDCKTLDISVKNKCVLATSDKFTSKQCEVDIAQSLGANVFDMEGGAIAEVCKSNSIPFISIKGISDEFGSGRAPEQFMENVTKVSNAFPSVIKEILKKL